MKNDIKKNHSQVKIHFEKISAVYPQNFSKVKSGKTHDFKTRLAVVRSFALNVRGKLLDCACGSGEITTAALTSGAFESAMVVDISKKMLDLAKDRVSNFPLTTNICFAQSNIFDFRPIDDEKYNFVLCLGLIAHTGSLTDLLIKLKYLLAPGGKIVLQTSLINHIGVKLVKLIYHKKYEKNHGYEIKYFSMADIYKSVSESGLHISTVTRYSFGFPFGDNISPYLNYLLERLMGRFSRIFGSEAIFLLELK